MDVVLQACQINVTYSSTSLGELQPTSSVATGCSSWNWGLIPPTNIGDNGEFSENKTKQKQKTIYTKIRGNHDTYEEIMEHQQKLTGM